MSDHITRKSIRYDCLSMSQNRLWFTWSMRNVLWSVSGVLGILNKNRGYHERIGYFCMSVVHWSNSFVSVGGVAWNLRFALFLVWQADTPFDGLLDVYWAHTCDLLKKNLEVITVLANLFHTNHILGLTGLEVFCIGPKLHTYTYISMALIPGGTFICCLR